MRSPATGAKLSIAAKVDPSLSSPSPSCGVKDPSAGTAMGIAD